MDFFTWALVLSALLGAVLNSCGRYLPCFKIWTVTNLFLFFINLVKSDYAQAFLFFAYFLTSLYGWHNLQNKITIRNVKSARGHKHENKLAKKQKATLL